MGIYTLGYQVCVRGDWQRSRQTPSRRWQGGVVVGPRGRFVALRVTGIAGGLLLGLALARPVLGDGIFFPSQAMGDAGRPSSAAQKAIVIQEGAEEVLLLQTTYQGPSSAFAWVVPVPAVPTEVFEAEPGFLEQVFLSTNPRAVTDVEADAAVGRKVATLGKAEGGEDGGTAAPVAGVTVHQRLEVGEYDASVLSAEGTDALVGWLQSNGYAVPDEAAKALKPYVERKCAFVAVRFLTGASDKRPTVRDVAPLGIRFPTEKLFFPLHISRGSAPPLTSILLCVFADGPVDCETIPGVWLPEASRTLPAGSTYGTLRREVARGGKGPRLLCEYSATGGIGYDDLSYRAEEWADPSVDTGLSSRHATRFFGLLAPGEMEDLTFRPAPDKPGDYRVLLERKGRISESAWTAWSAWRTEHWKTMRDADDIESGEPAQAGGIVARPSPRGPEAAAIEPTSPRRTLPLWPIGIAVLVVLAAAGVLLARRRRVLPLALLAVAGALAIGLAPRVVRAGGGNDALRELNSQLATLDQVVQSFVKDTGCYPASLADLAATAAPTTGLDASGNVVPLGGKWKGPYLHAVPGDLLGGKLAFDVLNLRPIDAGGWAIQVSGATRATADAAYQASLGPVRRGFEEHTAVRTSSDAKPRYWSVAYDQVRRNHELYASWLGDRSRDALVVGAVPHDSGGGGDPDDGFDRNRTTVVADPARGECFTHGPGVLAVDGATGAAYYAARFWHGAQADDLAQGTSGVFATTAGGVLARESKRPLPISASRGVLSGDGALAAVWSAAGASPLLVGPTAGPYTTVARGRFADVAFTPDADAVYALGWLERDFSQLAKGWWRDKRYSSTERRAGERQIADLLCVPLDGSSPAKVLSALGTRILSASRLGVLVYDADARLLLVPYGGGSPAEIPVPDGTYPVDARAFDEGIVYILAPLAMREPQSGVAHDAPWLAEAWLLERPGASPRRVATIRHSSRTELGIVGLDAAGAVTLAWHADINPTAPWVVKAIAPDGGARVLANQALPEVLYGEQQAWGSGSAGAGTVEPSEGAALP